MIRVVCLLIILTIPACTTTSLQPKLKLETTTTECKPDSTAVGFEKLIYEICADQKTLYALSNRWENAETALGLGLLASAAYGGFTTAFGGSDNLKDAAFSAATLTSLGAFGKPADRRDAALQASKRLLCLNNASRPFWGSFEPGNAILNTFIRQSAVGSSSVDKLFGLTANNAKGIVRSSVAENELITAVEAVEQSERKIYEQREVIVCTAANNILIDWREASKTTTKSFEQYQADYKKAIEASVAAEQNQKAVLEAAAQVVATKFLGRGLLAAADGGDKYAKAQEAVVACASI